MPAKRRPRVQPADAPPLPADGDWLLLIHQLPPEPAYVRVKLHRRLRRIGALAFKRSVYALPSSPEHLEDFQWLAGEIVAAGGEAAICSATFLPAVTARDRDRSTGARPARPESAPAAQKPRAAVWVTRRDVFVDRMASAWLIRRFIDREARFRFVAGTGHRPRRGELRFDMLDGEFTHEGNRCTFETLLRRFALTERPLRVIGEIVHDIDLKDDRFGRPETRGVEEVFRAIALSTTRDAERIRRAAELLDGLYRRFGQAD